jgi:hypothetical protein
MRFKSVSPNASSNPSRITKPIAGLPSSEDLLLKNYTTGKPHDIPFEIHPIPPSIIDQILPPPQVAPITHSGE